MECWALPKSTSAGLCPKAHLRRISAGTAQRRNQWYSGSTFSRTTNTSRTSRSTLCSSRSTVSRWVLFSQSFNIFCVVGYFQLCCATFSLSPGGRQDHCCVRFCVPPNGLFTSSLVMFLHAAGWAYAIMMLLQARPLKSFDLVLFARAFSSSWA